VRFIAALRFLTVIPLPIRREATPGQVGGSLVYFPAVGLLIGLVLAALYWVLHLVLPQEMVFALLLAATVLLNGALHIDGFIDTCDGLAGNKTAEERWQVMRDSRVGAFGVAGAVLLMLAKYASLVSLPDRLIPAVLVLMPLLGRWAMTFAIVAFPYARPSGLGAIFKGEAKPMAFAVSTGCAVVAAAGVAVVARTVYPHLFALAVVLGVWLIAAIWAAYLGRKFEGLTGDSYGAVNEVAEVSAAVVVNILAFGGWLGARG